jgi:murein DD-endopeptidase MepM/ murein hydrolase activator NlpD
VPARSSTRGRHRRPKNTGAPAYLTAATVATFAVSGVNVPGAIGAVRGSAPVPVAASTDVAAAPRVSAAEIRARALVQQAARASRQRAEQVAVAAAEATRLAELAKKEAERRAKEAARKARPPWVKPILNYRLTAGFGESSGLWSHLHTGQDFAAPIGTPIRAAGAGKIVSAEFDGAYGRKIVIQHADGTLTWYCHMSAFVLTSGSVEAGDVIGRVGNTGNTTGPHLHFEVRPGGGDPVSPLPWLRAHGVRV